MAPLLDSTTIDASTQTNRQCSKAESAQCSRNSNEDFNEEGFRKVLASPPCDQKSGQVELFQLPLISQIPA